MAYQTLVPGLYYSPCCISWAVLIAASMTGPQVCGWKNPMRVIGPLEFRILRTGPGGMSRLHNQQGVGFFEIISSASSKGVSMAKESGFTRPRSLSLRPIRLGLLGYSVGLRPERHKVLSGFLHGVKQRKHYRTRSGCRFRVFRNFICFLGFDRSQKTLPDWIGIGSVMEFLGICRQQLTTSPELCL